MLSQSAHADHRGVENFLAISQPDGTTQLLVAPERRVEVSNGTLALFASETRDVAAIIARERGVTIPHLDELDAAIAEHPFWTEENEEQDDAAVDTEEKSVEADDS